MMDNSKSRRRKISLQNDYAFCIISPVSSSSALPSYSPPTTIQVTPPIAITPSSKSSHRRLSDPLNPMKSSSSDFDFGVEIGEDAVLSILGQEMNTPTYGFRRWSICNFQASGQEVSPTVTEISSDFFSDDESDKMSRASSSNSMNWLSGIFSNIPERIRKLSTEKNKFNIQQQNEEVREQLKKMYVY